MSAHDRQAEDILRARCHRAGIPDARVNFALSVPGRSRALEAAAEKAAKDSEAFYSIRAHAGLLRWTLAPGVGAVVRRALHLELAVRLQAFQGIPAHRRFPHVFKQFLAHPDAWRRFAGAVVLIWEGGSGVRAAAAGLEAFAGMPWVWEPGYREREGTCPRWGQRGAR